MFIRYFARTDETELGRSALAYCGHLVATGIPVRLVPTRAAELQVDAHCRGGGSWGKYRDLLLTPMDGKYINAVCGEPIDWLKFYTPSAHRNVLMLAASSIARAVPRPTLMAAAEKYDAIYALTAELADVVERVTDRRPHIAPNAMAWAQ